MIRYAVAAYALLASALAAQELSIVQLSATKQLVQTGERFTVNMRWRNSGSAEARDITATLGSPHAFVLTGQGTSNWPCVPSANGSAFTCQGATLAPGAEAHMVVTMFAAANTNAPFVLTGTVSAGVGGADSEQLAIALTPSSTQADLAINGPLAIDGGSGTITLPFIIRNHGPATAQQLLAYLELPREYAPLHATGPGWSCANLTHSPQLMLCSRDALAAGASAPLTVTLDAPANAAAFAVEARVRAENSFDANDANGSLVTRLTFGTVEQWTRLLVPLIPNETPGANNARWKAETTLFVRSGEVLPPSLDSDPADRGGRFLYVRDTTQLHLNSRVWDLARVAETAGSEIAIAREEDFVAAKRVLVGIPVAPQFRHTLRVYDFDARNGTPVRIDVFANDETTPRASVTRVLFVSPFASTVTPAKLPTHPAYLELNPASLLSMDGITTLRIEVAPLDAATRIWTFVSVTNNETHHVTTFSAQ